MDNNNQVLTRLEAASLGKKIFFTGKPCKKGHLSQRYTTSGACIECCRELSKARSEKIRQLLGQSA